MTVVKYEHHGNIVSVREDLKGQHRAHCLCYSCGKFGRCTIAAAVFSNCVRFKVVTPVWECPDYEARAD